MLPTKIEFAFRTKILLVTPIFFYSCETWIHFWQYDFLAHAMSSENKGGTLKGLFKKFNSVTTQETKAYIRQENGDKKNRYKFKLDNGLKVQ